MLDFLVVLPSLLCLWFILGEKSILYCQKLFVSVAMEIIDFGIPGHFKIIIGSAEALPILCVRCAR